MAGIYNNEDYYHKLIDLQDKLRRSEEERLKLEERFNDMIRNRRDEEQMELRRLKAQCSEFLEEDKLRNERNEKILHTLERIEYRAAMLTAKTDRLRMLRRQYENYLMRSYTSWKNSSQSLAPIQAQQKLNVPNPRDLAEPMNPFPYPLRSPRTENLSHSKLYSHPNITVNPPSNHSVLHSPQQSPRDDGIHGRYPYPVYPKNDAFGENNSERWDNFDNIEDHKRIDSSRTQNVQPNVVPFVAAYDNSNKQSKFSDFNLTDNLRDGQICSGIVTNALQENSGTFRTGGRTAELETDNYGNAIYKPITNDDRKLPEHFTKIQPDTKFDEMGLSTNTHFNITNAAAVNQQLSDVHNATEKPPYRSDETDTIDQKIPFKENFVNSINKEVNRSLDIDKNPEDDQLILTNTQDTNRKRFTEEINNKSKTFIADDQTEKLTFIQKTDIDALSDQNFDEKQDQEKSEGEDLNEIETVEIEKDNNYSPEKTGDGGSDENVKLEEQFIMNKITDNIDIDENPSAIQEEIFVQNEKTDRMKSEASNKNDEEQISSSENAILDADETQSYENQTEATSVNQLENYPSNEKDQFVDDNFEDGNHTVDMNPDEINEVVSENSVPDAIAIDPGETYDENQYNYQQSDDVPTGENNNYDQVYDYESTENPVVADDTNYNGTEFDYGNAEEAPTTDNLNYDQSAGAYDYQNVEGDQQIETDGYDQSGYDYQNNGMEENPENLVYDNSADPNVGYDPNGYNYENTGVDPNNVEQNYENVAYEYENNEAVPDPGISDDRTGYEYQQEAGDSEHTADVAYDNYPQGQTTSNSGDIVYDNAEYQPQDGAPANGNAYEQFEESSLPPLTKQLPNLATMLDSDADSQVLSEQGASVKDESDFDFSSEAKS